jgi:hypothetical protein
MSKSYFADLVQLRTLPEIKNFGQTLQLQNAFDSIENFHGHF